MKIKEEKGSMAIYATIVLVTILIILMAVYITSTAVRKGQLETVMKIKQTYEADNSRADEIYESLAQGKSTYAFMEEFETLPNYQTLMTSINVENGIITLASTGPDPQVFMTNVADFSPLEYRYIEVRYKTTTTSNIMEFFMTESPTDGTYSIKQEITTDGEWHTVIFDLWSNENVKNLEKITSWRWDWCDTAVAGDTMEVDYIRIKN